MNEVVKHVLNFEIRDEEEEIPENPDFEEKIIFNKLSMPVANILNSARMQLFVIDEYFLYNSNFTKEDLRNKFNGIYESLKEETPESDTKGDEIFFGIRNTASPNKKIAAYSAVYVLMAYYFEYCDIYETMNS